MKVLNVFYKFILFIVGLFIVDDLLTLTLMTSSNGILVKKLLTLNDAINVLFASITVILSTNVNESFKQRAEKCFTAG